MTDLDRSHDPSRTSWVTSANGHRDFPIQNLPFGVIEGEGEDSEVVVAIGDMVLHLRSAVAAGWGSELSIDAITRIVFGPLNHLAAASPREWLRHMQGPNEDVPGRQHPVAPPRSSGP